MVDPLTEVVSLLHPRALISKIVSGAGHWSVRRTDYGSPFYCVVLEGTSRLAVDGHKPIILREGDFVLLPSAAGFTASSLKAGRPRTNDRMPAPLLHCEVRHGTRTGPPEVRMLVGHCEFGSPDAALLISLIPQLVHVRGEKRLATIVQLVGDESRALRPARDVILARLLEVLLVEALRSTAGGAASPGLVRGLADERLAPAIRRMHEHPARRWTIAQLAKAASLSRSAFFERFKRAVGVAPMEYLLAWRMAIAKKLLRQKTGGVAEVAGRVGYRSASAFSVAFTRHVGVPPGRFAGGAAADGEAQRVGRSPSKLGG